VPLGVAGLLDWVDLRAQEVGAQEVVGHAQAAGRIPLEQVKTAIAPEVRTGQAGATTSRECEATCCRRNSIWSEKMRRLVRIRYSALFGTYGA
jgi:hypothetical protein